MKHLLLTFFIVSLGIGPTPFSATTASASRPDIKFTKGVSGVLTQQIQEDLHFSLVPIFKTNAGSWSKFAREAEKFFNSREVEYGYDIPIALRQASGGASQVSRVFDRKVTDEDGNNVWMGIFSYQPLSFDESLRLNKSDWKNIEMAMTVSTKADAPFAVHMGIFRNTFAYYKRFSPEGGGYSALERAPKMHRGISVLLHKTVAQAVNLYRKMHKQAALQYMITSPLDMMRKIIVKAMPEGAVAVGSNIDGEKNERYKAYKKKQLAKIKKKAVYAKTTPIYKTYGAEGKFVRFELRNEDGEVVWSSDSGDDSWWLVGNASNLHPCIAVEYANLASIKFPRSDDVSGEMKK